MQIQTDEWQPIDTAPRDGSRVRLGNERDASSMKRSRMFSTTGYWDGHQWVLSAFFIVPGGPHGLMTNEPTHWAAATGSAN